ncbi:MAG TPA: PilZ domain-containing protein [Phycisphaerae bacterium]|nr:PilZ domain-containing protein [Phycisphaerae bacterium]
MATSSERRKHRRFEVPCRLRIEAPGGHDVRARTANVCDGGVYFVVDRGLELGREVYVQLTVPRDTANTFFLEQFAARAQVIRCDRPSAGESGTGVALKFEKELALDLF